jgi:hypothetical protein
MPIVLTESSSLVSSISKAVPPFHDLYVFGIAQEEQF